MDTVEKRRALVRVLTKAVSSPVWNDEIANRLAEEAVNILFPGIHERARGETPTPEPEQTPNS